MAISIDRVEGGKILEEWGSWDMFGMMQQLGSVPMARH
jgi:predicted ester cyclase